jgi:hypothetical protein
MNGDFKPTDQAITFKNEITAEINKHLETLTKIFKEEVPALNALIKQKNVDAIVLSE